MSLAHELRAVVDDEKIHMASQKILYLAACVVVSSHLLRCLQDWLMSSGVALLFGCEVERIGQKFSWC